MYAEICRISPFHHPEQPRHTAFATAGIPLPLFPDDHGKGFFFYRHAVKFNSSFPETEYLPLNAACFVHPHRAGSFFFPVGLALPGAVVRLLLKSRLSTLFQKTGGLPHGRKIYRSSAGQLG